MRIGPAALVLLLAASALAADTPLQAALRKYLALPTPSEREEMAPELAPFDATPVEELTKAIEGVLPQPSGPGPIERHVMTNKGEIRYVLEFPDGYDPSKAYPVLFWMMNTATQPDDSFLTWTSSKLGNRYVVAAPALPADDPDFAGYPTYDTGDVAMEAMFNDLGRAAHVDPSRLFVGGFSMGGELAWSAAVLQGDRVAGAFPLSAKPPNNAAPECLRNVRHVPLFITHGSSDQIVEPHFARDVVDLLKGYGYAPEYHEVAGAGHVWPEQLEGDMIRWMEGKKRVLFPKEVTYHLLYWSRPMRRMYWLEPTKGKYQLETPDGTRLYAGVTGRIEGNRIELTSTLLTKITIYLNSALVDFSRDVVIVANGVERFRGRVTPSLAFALEGFRERWDREDLYSAKVVVEIP